MAAILLVLRWRIGRDWRRQLAFRLPSGLSLLLVIVAFPGFLILVSGWQELLSNQFHLQPDKNAGETLKVFDFFPVWLAVATIGLGPGIFEELFCRGFLGRGMCSRHGLALGIAITSLLFGFLHISPSYAILVAPMGAYLHFIYLTTRSILTPMLVHALNNSISMLAFFGYIPLAQMEVNVQVVGSVFYLLAFSLCLFSGIALWTGRPRLVLLDPNEAWVPEYPGIGMPPREVRSRITSPWPSPVSMILAILSAGSIWYLVLK